MDRGAYGTYVKDDKWFGLVQTVILEVLGIGLEDLLIQASYNLPDPANVSLHPPLDKSRPAHIKTAMMRGMTKVCSFNLNARRVK